MYNFNKIINYEEEIKNVINTIKNEYGDLTIEGTCLIFSSLVHNALKEKHIVTRLINTEELNIKYSHYFVLVYSSKEKYLIDLTFNQFFETVPETFSYLSHNGYMPINNDTFSKYIKIISSVNKKSKKI